MKTPKRVLLGLAAIVIIAIGTAAAFDYHSRSARPTKLPPLPPGVTELKFNEFFVYPAGPRGLEPSAKLRSLDGKRVRMLGYMVRHDGAPAGRFMFTPVPIEMHDHDDHCFIDDLPASTVWVSAPDYSDKKVPHAKQLLLLTGTLSLGNREEADGRISMVRLQLDPEKPRFWQLTGLFR